MVPISKQLFVGLGHPKYTGARSKYKSRYVFWIYSFWLWLVLEHLDPVLLCADLWPQVPAFATCWFAPPISCCREVCPPDLFAGLSSWQLVQLLPVCLRHVFLWSAALTGTRLFSILCNHCLSAYFEHPHLFDHLRLCWCIYFLQSVHWNMVPCLSKSWLCISFVNDDYNQLFQIMKLLLFSTFLPLKYISWKQVLDSLIVLAVARHRHCYVPNNLTGPKVNVTESWDCVVWNKKNVGWHLDELWERGDAAWWLV